jgi:hypothetical protein
VFQEQAAATLHAALVAGAPAGDVHAALTDLHARLIPREMSDTAP